MHLCPARLSVVADWICWVIMVIALCNGALEDCANGR